MSVGSLWNAYVTWWEHTVSISCPFTPLTNWKIKIKKKRKKHLEISSFYMCVPKIMIRWCLVPEIWCPTDNFFSFWRPFVALPPPPSPTNNPKNQNFENIKNIPGDIVILHMCTVNENHMIYGSWDIKHDTEFFCHFG